ncbi:MAG: transcriptional repressor [Ignavibacteriae bacterium]|nr:transcriptional repressor [Ignavibacteria bacterium]MBI3365122.1 transcriptional repressor [Ignavibacteriota bacterium]
MDITAVKNTLTHYLREKNLRPTKERYLLLEEIMQTNGHFDADELYASLAARGMKASRATVYNTLDLLVGCGLISKYRFGENHCRYEKAFGRPRHDHLICLACGDILEFVHDKLDKLQKEVSEQKKFKIHNSTLQIFGICSKCQSMAKDVPRSNARKNVDTQQSRRRRS